jgi:hypothetical protein
MSTHDGGFSTRSYNSESYSSDSRPIRGNLRCIEISARANELDQNPGRRTYRPGARRYPFSGENDLVVLRSEPRVRLDNRHAILASVANNRLRIRSQDQDTEARPPLLEPELQYRCRKQPAAKRRPRYPPEANPLEFSFSFSCPPYAIYRGKRVANAKLFSLRWKRIERWPRGTARGAFQPLAGI